MCVEPSADVHGAKIVFFYEMGKNPASFLFFVIKKEAKRLETALLGLQK